MNICIHVQRTLYIYYLCTSLWSFALQLSRVRVPVGVVMTKQNSHNIQIVQSITTNIYQVTLFHISYICFWIELHISRIAVLYSGCGHFSGHFGAPWKTFQLSSHSCQFSNGESVSHKVVCFCVNTFFFLVSPLWTHHVGQLSRIPP